jgi:hypothetical protein
VSTFDPKRYMMKLQGKDYLPVAPRLYWFRQEHPDYGIKTEELHADEKEGVYRVECSITNAEGRVVAMGRGRETTKGFAAGPYEKAETIAIGRALSALGYGTMDSLDYAESGDDKLADSPQPARPRAATEADVTADYGPPPEPAPVPGNAERRTISNPDAPLSEKQLAALQTMASKLGYEDVDRQAIVYDKFGVTGGFKSLNKGQASEVFDMLKGQLEAAK